MKKTTNKPNKRKQITHTQTPPPPPKKKKQSRKSLQQCTRHTSKSHHTHIFISATMPSEIISANCFAFSSFCNNDYTPTIIVRSGYRDNCQSQWHIQTSLNTLSTAQLTEASVRDWTVHVALDLAQIMEKSAMINFLKFAQTLSLCPLTMSLLCFFGSSSPYKHEKSILKIGKLKLASYMIATFFCPHLWRLL